MKTLRRPVTRARPCPVCNGSHKCSIGDDGSIFCGRVSGEVPGYRYFGQCERDEQWGIYRPDDGSTPYSGNGHSKPAAPEIDWEQCARELAKQLTDDCRIEIAEILGLPVWPFTLLRGLGFDRHDFNGPCWTFPESSASGRIIGLNRRYINGTKKAMPDSKRGLTLVDGWRERGGPIFLPEGASCALTMTALGLAAVGRPSNFGGVEYQAQLLNGTPADREIVVVGENDEKENGDWPGRDGAVKTAQQLASTLNRSVAWTLPPDGIKDVRAWVNSRKLDPTIKDGWDDLGAELLGRLELNHVGKKDDPPNKPIRVTIGELIEKCPRLHEPLFDGLMRRQETGNTVSSSKVGKSFLLYGKILSLITGRRWLDRFSCRPGRVLLIDNELHQPTIAYRIRTVAEAMEIQLADYRDKLEIMPLRGNLRDIFALRPEIEGIEHGEFSYVVIDAKYRLIPSGVSENDNAAETEFYNALDAYAEMTGAAFDCVHHSSKGSQADKRITDVGAGASAQSRAADSHVVLREHEQDNCVVLEAAVRSFAPVEPLALRWTFPLWVPADDIDPSQLKGRMSAQEERQHARDAKGTDEIIRRLKQGPATQRQLRDLGIGPERLERLLGIMTASGQVTWSEIMVRGNKTREYSLRGPDVVDHVPDHVGARGGGGLT